MGRPGLTRHRKFLRLARILDDACPNFGIVVALGSLELLWSACYESGEPYLGDADDVEAQAGWKGRRGVLVQALMDAGGDGCVGFIEETAAGRYQVHDLWDHAPDYVRKRRQREQERRTTGANLRTLHGHQPVSDQALTSQCPPNGSQRPPNGETPAPAPAPAPAPSPPPPVEPAGDGQGLGYFRSALAKRLGVGKVTIGKDPANVIRFFQAQLAGVGEKELLADCVEAARRSTTGTPSSLSWFVGWLDRLETPTPPPKARQ